MAEQAPPANPQPVVLDPASITAIANVVKDLVVEHKLAIDPTRPLQSVMTLLCEVNVALGKLQAATNVTTAKAEVGSKLTEVKRSLEELRDAWETLSLNDHQKSLIAEESSYAGLPPSERMQLRMLSKMDTLVHKMSRPPSSRYGPPPSGVGMRCYVCNQPGHMAKDCPKKKPPVAN
ncbi:hypothetical protein Pmar_PMAR021230 [Perkinsus marinus ATCC 50983]|uniref:CCHC-type domain-containing protein n=1 Tax=Perkinsus marinus (strain ATCC 50983 / TXsc) TaxID=423536 RepID=C5LRE7_PERM5|nr:hypothetical protein Pmar_PMAR021230 [Perkinsus marinus ATCC 50983]EER00695.1 hypothetical protein Pmar_PMAR021230 [Perkinsus marinus ATCC 50983]|eukprot:XP_002767977.1 hypothetical protein Pmar_PMAR021230 [Perkinsus marinus ATCC 50983]